MKWSAFVYQGQVFDLTHLDSFEHTFVQPAETDKPMRFYRTWVKFSHHCFTEDIKSEDDPHLTYPTQTDIRAFNLRRWRLSQYLPEIIKALMTRHISHTEHQSFLTIELIDQSNEIFEYNIFFEVRRATNDKRLHLVISSAFPRDEDRSSSRPKSNKVRFSTILFNVQNHKPIRLKK
jgi:hypothetical protein